MNIVTIPTRQLPPTVAARVARHAEYDAEVARAIAEREAGEAAQRVRELIASVYPDRADDVKAFVNAQLDASEIPDDEALSTLRAIASFYAGVAERIEAGELYTPRDKFTSSQRMDQATFTARLSSSDRPVIAQRGRGYTDVFDARTGEHIARWTLGMLYFDPPKPTAPTCQRCGRTMELYESEGHLLFWGCPNYWVNGCKQTVDPAPKSDAERDALRALLIEQQQTRKPARRRRARARAERVRVKSI
jgi:hypothetical protein